MTKKDNDKENDTGWEKSAACGGGSTKCLDYYLAGGGLLNRKRKRMTNQNGKRPIQSILIIFRTTRINCNYIKNLGIAYPHQRAHFT